MRQGLLVVHGKWFVPNVREIKGLILQESHDCNMTVHGGIHQALINNWGHFF